LAHGGDLHCPFCFEIVLILTPRRILMFSRIIHFLYGDISPQEMKKFGLLSLTFFFTIGSYWLLRPLKDGLFFKMVGKLYQPRAKMLSVLVVLVLVIVYTKLIEMFDKHKLFYIIGGFYALIFLSSAYFLMHPTIGLANTSVGPHRLLGWVLYFAIESFGSIAVSLFWSFTNSITDSASAKRGFALIIGGAQIGSIAGGYLATQAERVGIPFLFGLAGTGVLAVAFMVMFFMKVIPEDQRRGNEQAAATETKKTGFFEGVRLILTRPYILGIFIVSTLYEVIGTIIDYQMKSIASDIYSTPEALTVFLGWFAMAANGLSLVLALLGTSYLMRRFGLTFCLLAFPASMAAAVSYLWYFARFGTPTAVALMWTSFVIMIITKGLSYALNNPSKELMYIPTSKAAKFKAKGWIDLFGGRSAKAGGAAINDTILKAIPSVTNMVQMASVISLGIVGIWAVAALGVGRKFATLTKEGKIVE